MALRLAVISDTHGRPFTIPSCDVFIHCGDITAGGTMVETDHFAAWLRRQTQIAGRSLLIPGNHDRCFQEYQVATTGLFADDRVSVLIDSGININGKTFWGSPWTPPFMNWWFMAEEEKLHLKHLQIPQELDILITHGPPRGILDPGHQDPHVGSTALLQAIKSRNIGHHFFGHLHAAGGMRAVIGYDGNIVRHYNVAACDEAYNLVRNCRVVDI